MKKITTLLLCLALLVSLAACGSDTKKNNSTETPATATPTGTGEPDATPTGTPIVRENINVAVLKGPTAIGMLPLMDADEKNTSRNDYTFTVAGSADAVVGSIIKGDIPIAAVPCNLAATLYQKTNGGVAVAAVNTLGVLYILETGESISTVTDLKGKTIYATGAGTTPEYTLRYLLTSAGIDPDKDVNIVLLSEASEAAAKLAAADKGTVAMLPMPYVISVLKQNADARIALDVTKEWEKLNSSTVVTGVIVVNRRYLESHKPAVDAFLAEYAESTAFAAAEVEQTAELSEHFDIFKKAIAKEAIPYCNIVCLTGSDMKTAVSAYLEVLHQANPASVGGKLPDDAFYYMP